MMRHPVIFILFLCNVCLCKAQLTDTLYNPDAGTQTFTHLYLSENPDSILALSSSFNSLALDSERYSNCVLYRITGNKNIQELIRLKEPGWNIGLAGFMPFEPEAGRFLYLMSDTAKREFQKYKQVKYRIAETTDGWKTYNTRPLDLPVKRYHLKSCLKTAEGYVISGDTSIFTNTPSFLAHYNKNMSLVKFHVFNTSYNIYSILPANGGYLLSGYKYFLPVPNDFPVMWQSKINGDGTMIWEKEYKDTARYMNSSFMGQGLKIGNVYYNYGFNGINNENFRNIYAHLNAINENGDLILDKTYTQHTNFFFMKMVEKNNALYAVGRFDSMIHPDTSAQLVHFSKISPQTGKIEWYQLYKHWHYNTIWNLYNDSSGFMMCGTAVNPNRMEEFNANGVIDGDGWLLKVDTNGCIVPGCKPNVYSGIQHILRDNSLVEVYPNPVTDCFTVALKNNQLFNCESTLFIHDESGRELYNSAIKAQTRSIELKHAFGYSGVAYIVITNSNGTFYKKIVFK